MTVPQTFLVGYQTINLGGMLAYLQATNNSDFLKSILAARAEGIHDGEILCSFYAKLCYASLTVGKNRNIAGVRDVKTNLEGCFDAAHGSVFEHCNINFVTTGCSRVFTHELVRHRAGTAFSQTSGRYVRTDELHVVADPILQEYGILSESEELQLRLSLESTMRLMSARIDAANADRDTRKRLTSAMRRWLPNGQANEIGWSVNIRQLRHMVQLRTSRHAEWEIRTVFGDVYRLARERFPMLFYGAKERIVDGLLEVYGMRMQPYEEVSDASAIT